MQTLHYSPFCPFSRQVSLLMREKKIDFYPEEEKMANPSPRFLSLNPAGTVPVLETAEGAIIVHEYAIAEYLEETFPHTNFIGTSPLQRAEVRRLVHWFNAKFYQEVTLNLVFEKIMKRQLGQGGPDSIALRRGRVHILEHLDYITFLCNNRNWLAGDLFSLADIAAASHFSCVDYGGDVPWEKYPLAKEWYVRIKSRPTFRLFLQENVPGITPAAHYTQLDF